MRITRLATAALLAVLPLTTTPRAASAQAAKGTLDDAAIVGIFDAANGWDISTGSLAAKKATRKDVNCQRAPERACPSRKSRNSGSVC